MKKFAALLLSLILFFGLFALPVNAQEVYEIEGKPFSVAVPDGCVVIDRNFPADDPVLDPLGMTKEEFIAHYLDAQACDALFLFLNDSFALGIAAEEVEYNYSLLTISEEELEEERVLAVEAINNPQLVDSATLRYEKSVWIKLMFDRDEDPAIEEIVYISSHNGYLYNITLYPLPVPELTDEMEATADELLSTASFLDTTEPEPTSTVYEDEEIGIVFDLSDGWSYPYVYDNLLHSNNEDETNLFLTYYSDSAFDPTKTDEELLMEWSGLEQAYTVVTLKRETIGGIEYVRGYAEGFFAEERTVTQIYLCECGGTVYNYAFLHEPYLYAKLTSPSAFMEKVTYTSGTPASLSEKEEEPSSKAPETSSAPAEKPEKEAEPMPMWILLVIFVGFFAVVGGVILVIVVSMKKKKTEEKTDFELRYEKGTYAPLYAPQTDEPKAEAPLYCTQCGEKLAEDSKFCSKCGSPVAKEP